LPELKDLTLGGGTFFQDTGLEVRSECRVLILRDLEKVKPPSTSANEAAFDNDFVKMILTGHKHQERQEQIRSACKIKEDIASFARRRAFHVW